MTATSTDVHVDPAVERQVDRYRRLLALYPRSFRVQYGDDLLQTYRDLLLFSSDHRVGRWSTTRDLLTSATRERWDTLHQRDRPSTPEIVGIAALVLAAVILGSPGIMILLLPAGVLVALPIYGLTCFANAWTTHRAAAGGTGRHVLTGLASIAPAPAAIAYFGSDAGYIVFLAVAATVIVTATAGTIWACARLVRPAEPRRSAKSLLVLVPCVAVLGIILTASLT
jgi:hypothetical protein